MGHCISLYPFKRSQTTKDDIEFLLKSLDCVGFFDKFELSIKQKIVNNMTQMNVDAGDIIIEAGIPTHIFDQMFIVESGSFDIIAKKSGVVYKVSTRTRGQSFGELALVKNITHPFTIIARSDSVVWGIQRDKVIDIIRNEVEGKRTSIALFLKNIPALEDLSKMHMSRLVDNSELMRFRKNDKITIDDDSNVKVFIVKQGDANEYVGDNLVRHIHSTDLCGIDYEEGAQTRTICVTSEYFDILSIEASVFREIIEPYKENIHLFDLRTSAEQTRRLSMFLVNELHERVIERTDVFITTPWGHQFKIIGHMPEVEAICPVQDVPMTLEIKGIHGQGAFSTVFYVKCKNNGSMYALKRIPKSRVSACKKHVFHEKLITTNIMSSFCVRQHASFQDSRHLYMLIDSMECNIMSVLYSLCKQHTRSCFCFSDCAWVGMSESVARFYVACVVIGLKHLHKNKIIYRDLKPENVLIDKTGYARLADFGMSMVLEDGARAFTFCGTPAYLAPEIVHGQGYDFAVDWWSLGVFIYVLLTATQPFDNPHCIDPMEVIKRIGNPEYEIKYPMYMSKDAKDLIQGLLQRGPAERMKIALDIERHPWFMGFDWHGLVSRKAPPPNVKIKSSISSVRNENIIKLCQLSFQTSLSRRVDDTFRDF